ncbi:MAG TPA: DUF998 domain-containing protein [Anaerolineales bacterium]
MKKLLMLCGVSAAVIYIGTVLLGGLLRPGYSHISMAISELVADGAPNRALLSSLFLVYNALLSVFGTGLLLKVNSRSRGWVSGMIGSLALLLVGLAGILMEVAFPQEPGGAATTFAGIMHFVMAGVAALGTMVAILMLAFWFKNISALKGYVVYSLISVAVIFLSGGLGAAAMANHSPLFGLIERITIFTFTLWMFVIGWKMTQLEGKTSEQLQFEVIASTLKGN